MKKIYSKSGVYALKAIEDNIIYIGSTKCLSNRKSNHFSLLKRNSQYFPELQGKDVEFEIIELCDNYLEREQYWIDFYKLHPTLKIINVFDAYRKGSKVPDNFKNKMSDILQKRWKDKIYRNNILQRLEKTQFKKGQKSLKCKITIAQLKDGSLLEFNSVKSAAEYFNFPTGSVVTYIGRKKIYKNIKFYYK